MQNLQKTNEIVDLSEYFTTEEQDNKKLPSDIVDLSEYFNEEDAPKSLQESISNEEKESIVDLSEYFTTTPKISLENIPQKITYDGIKQNDAIKTMAIRFAKNHLGYEDIDGEEAIDEMIEQDRKSVV
mgnify:FL=1